MLVHKWAFEWMHGWIDGWIKYTNTHAACIALHAILPSHSQRFGVGDKWALFCIHSFAHLCEWRDRWKCNWVNGHEEDKTGGAFYFQLANPCNFHVHISIEWKHSVCSYFSLLLAHFVFISFSLIHTFNNSQLHYNQSDVFVAIFHDDTTWIKYTLLQSLLDEEPKRTGIRAAKCAQWKFLCVKENRRILLWENSRIFKWYDK